jgi:hypothetical protein
VKSMPNPSPICQVYDRSVSPHHPLPPSPLQEPLFHPCSYHKHISMNGLQNAPVNRIVTVSCRSFAVFRAPKRDFAA